MKKLLCVFLAVIMLLSLVACNNEEKPQGTTNVPVANEGTQPQKETTKPTETTAKTEKEMQKFMFPLVKVFCDVPVEYGRKTNGKTAVVTGRDEFIATIFNGDAGAYTGDLEGILAFAAEKFSQDTAKYLIADLDPAELKASSVEKVTVSGYEAVKFSSSAKNMSGNTYAIYGYAMIIEERPVMFVGVLCSEDQAKADLEAMKDLVDLMAGSIYK